MKVSLCQYGVHWNAPEANFGTIEELCSGIETDLLVLPEMFSSGFAPNPSTLADPLAIKTTQWMKSFSSNRLVIGSTPTKQQEQFFNTLLVTYNQKVVSEYHKRHVYLGSESDHYSKGSNLGLFKHKEWNIGLNICYDLRFPAWSRAQKADLLIYSANWPSARKEHWHALLKARAIENQCYVIGVNRIGTDQNEWSYEGESLVFDFWGNEVLNLGNEETVTTTTLDYNALQEYREKLSFLGDRDHFTLDV